MSRSISIDRIIEATLDGIEEASKDYREWSGGEWLWNAPEYLITVKIAENISKIEGSKYITLEDKVKYVLGLSKKRGRGQVSDKARANGRSDIVLWYTDEKPRAIIEVKNSVFAVTKIVKDIDRIESVLKKYELQFGVVAFYIDRHYKKGNAKEQVEQKIKTIFEEIKEKYSSMSCSLYPSICRTNREDTDAWASVVILFKNV